jgi:outer membrane protein insertion porin family
MLRGLILSAFLCAIALGQTSAQKVHVEFAGNKVFSSDVLQEKLNSCIERNSDSVEKYDSNLYEYCLRKDVLGYFRQNGYLNARTEQQKSEEKEKISKLVVRVKEGEQYRLGNVNIQGTKIFKSDELREKLDLKTGDIADGEELRVWLFERVKNLYADEGYIQSSFDLEPIFKTVGDKQNAQSVDINVTVDEGQRFTINRITFSGNQQTSDAVLRTAFLIQEEMPFSQKKFEESIKKLNELMLFEPIDKDRDVDFRSDAESPLLNINIRVKEKLLADKLR